MNELELLFDISNENLTVTFDKLHLLCNVKRLNYDFINQNSD